MKRRQSVVLSLLAVVAGLYGGYLLAQQAQSAPPAQTQQYPRPSTTPEMLEIYRVDLVGGAAGFALGKPVLEGNAYVFRVWPERDIVHLDKSKVKKISRWTKDINQMYVYQIDLVPTGRMLAKEQPTLKGTSYVFHTWRDGALMTMRQADVQKVTKLTGVAAYRAQEEEKGAAVIGNLPMEGGTYTQISPAPEVMLPGSATEGETSNPQGNWSYQGAPGLTDAYAPANAVVSSPGDVPKAPEPTRPPQ